MGLEPMMFAWKAKVFPLHYIRILWSFVKVLPFRFWVTNPVYYCCTNEAYGEPHRNLTCLTCFADKRLNTRSEVHWQGQQDLNLQQTVLETATLTIELCPSMVAVERFKLSYVRVKI